MAKQILTQLAQQLRPSGIRWSRYWTEKSPQLSAELSSERVPFVPDLMTMFVVRSLINSKTPGIMQYKYLFVFDGTTLQTKPFMRDAETSPTRYQYLLTMVHFQPDNTMGFILLDQGISGDGSRSPTYGSFEMYYPWPENRSNPMQQVALLLVRNFVKLDMEESQMKLQYLSLRPDFFGANLFIPYILLVRMYGRSFESVQMLFTDQSVLTAMQNAALELNMALGRTMALCVGKFAQTIQNQQAKELYLGYLQAGAQKMLDAPNMGLFAQAFQGCKQDVALDFPVEKLIPAGFKGPVVAGLSDQTAQQNLRDPRFLPFVPASDDPISPTFYFGATAKKKPQK